MFSESRKTVKFTPTRFSHLIMHATELCLIIACE